ncbi:hypothetical protein [Youngiibacter fragilis]|uniref:Molybdopterin cofactor biosynthesis MoaD-related C-terminal domain-containing protein n=1 Tax=Youngiibacter fragilis 232.1 TaxID=994573 RepID=V7IAM0_9CLOT|nr:hypothetical protein [Youngiibacter fragilis]ETA81902.1 hypothetical protein T472_0203960 [Youngiibacter fragilis 232.1]
MIKRTFLMRGKERHEFMVYFERIGGIPSDLPDGAIIFKGGPWTARIGPQTVYMLRTIPFPEVEVTIEAEDEVFEALLKDYRIMFLTAGG